MDNNTKKEDLLNECEQLISSIMNYNYTVVFAGKSDTPKAPAGEASLFSKKITLKYNWDDLFNGSPKATTAKHTLYYIIGHELGHKDSEPFDIMLISFIVSIVTELLFWWVLGRPFSIPFWYCVLFLVAWFFNFPMFSSRLRELRADYCGILFALKCIYGDSDITQKERSELISEVFDYLIEKSPDDKPDHAHPTLAQRKAYLLANKIFDKEFIKKLSEQMLLGKILEVLYLKTSFDGILLKLQDHIQSNEEEKHG